MPELPEVDLVARTLATLVTEKRISTAKLIRERLAPDTTRSAFARSLKNAAISNVSRRGKHILIALDNGRTLIVHLRMSGRFSLLNNEDADPKFTHAVLNFDDGTRLTFDDQRHFGMMKIVLTKDVAEAKELKKLAPEPFSDDFSPTYLHTQLKGSKRVLKAFLLDQTKVCGLGNIYAAEAMFAAGLNPKKRTNKVSGPRSQLLFDAIITVLSEQIEMSKMGDADPKNVDGRYFADNIDRQWVVYDRENEPCPHCKTPITRITQNGRSTYYCVRCQR